VNLEGDVLVWSSTGFFVCITQPESASDLEFERADLTGVIRFEGDEIVISKSALFPASYH
jgi:hypothetical protein